MPGKAMIAGVVGVSTLALAAGVLAAPDARLGGDFKMKGEITSTRGFTGQKAGDQITRIYKFRPRCASGPCDKVTFRRERADGTFRRSVARRKKPGVYKAVDKARSTCTTGYKVSGYHTVTTRTKVTIKRAVDGKATKIAASGLVTAPKTKGCLSARQKASLTGTRS